MSIPDPPEGFRIATSTWEVFEAMNQHRRDRPRNQYLRLLVRGRWVPGGVDVAIGAVQRPASRNVPVVWDGDLLKEARRQPFERIAIPVETKPVLMTDPTPQERAMDERARRVQRLRFGNAAGPHGRTVAADVPCVCASGFTCVARVHDDEPPTRQEHDMTTDTTPLTIPNAAFEALHTAGDEPMREYVAAIAAPVVAAELRRLAEEDADRLRQCDDLADRMGYRTPALADEETRLRKSRDRLRARASDLDPA